MWIRIQTRPQQKGHVNQVVMRSGNCAENIPLGEHGDKRGAGISSILDRFKLKLRRLVKDLELHIRQKSRRRNTGTFSATQTKEDLEHNRFARALHRIRNSPYYSESTESEAPHGYYEGRHIITGNSRINGGVYLGAIAHEAVVVDEKYGTLNTLYNELILRFARENSRRDCLEERIFKQVIKLTREKLPLNHEGVRSLAFKNHIKPDRKAALDFYIKEKRASARHQVLLAGYFLEKLKSRGLIDGAIGIDAQFSELPAEDEKLIFTTSNGAVFTFDPQAER